ncbi:MAG TPA: hypothetical protein VNN62_04285 [Methylomirabilota bacterium]|nr:hypothetical protein [Methylomirabilota bacterium]
MKIPQLTACDVPPPMVGTAAWFYCLLTRPSFLSGVAAITAATGGAY